MENYFNYFTEIEECFRRARGTPTLLSTLDWALIESWKEAGLPLEAVLLGIERSFEKFHKRPGRFQKVNSLAYCTQEVLRAAEQAQTAQAEGGGDSEAVSRPPFDAGEIRAYLEQNARALDKAAERAREKIQPVLAEDLEAAATAVRKIAAREPSELEAGLEEIERFLSAAEEKLSAALLRAASVELLAEFRREVERGLTAYRRKMSAPQIESLERQFLKKRLFEHCEVPRLSLFYL